MDLRSLKFMVALVFAERIWSLPLACPYNGTAHGDGETVRTEEPCLSCTCRGGALECSLRVCADQPNVLPPGCFFLHKPNECCPQLFCEEESFSPPGIELRTSLKLENKLRGNDCTINGSLYAEGSAVASSRVCEYCYCVEGETKCIKPRCLQSFEVCKAIYEKSSCCPTHYDCRDADIDLLEAQIENFVLASVDSSAPSRVLPNLYAENEKTTLNKSESAENLTEKGTNQTEEIRMTTTTTQEINTEQTTAQPPKEATTPAEEGSLTYTGFQTMTTEYFTEEPTEADKAEQTTSVSETTTDASSSVLAEETEKASDAQSGFGLPPATERSAAISNHESRNDSSQEVDDYESYDYGEPQLPPSLPNLVIFPFVAADAVIKDDTRGVLDVHDEVTIKRMDAHPVFYKDYFSPPVKTEGGFVPKEPFYGQAYFREDQVESPGADPKAAICRDVPCPLPGKQRTKIISTVSVVSDLKSVKTQLGEEIPPSLETPADFIFRDDSQTFQKNQQTKKPVTVTYKNIVVDFYPNYLVTTTRARPKIQPAGDSATEIQPTAGGFHIPPPKILNAFAETTSETKLLFSEEIIPSTSPKITRETPTTTAESSFFDEFFKSFLSDEIISTTAVTTTTTTTTTTAAAGTKHRYSSKIKGHANGLREEAGPGVKPEPSKTVSSTDSLPNSLIRAENAASPFPVTDEPVPPEDGATRRQVEKEGSGNFTEASINHFSAAAAPEEINGGPVEFFQALGGENPSKEKGKQEALGHGPAEESNSVKPDAGALLKLAGCNIYGMMYRVGKLIAELSGPCLECLCTDLGVQCRPLAC